MAVYETRFGPTLGWLDTPMAGEPEEMKPIRPDTIISAAGIRILMGGRGWRLYWRTVDPPVIADIMTRTGGETDSSIEGFIQIKDWVPRSLTQETVSRYSCILDQPIEGDFDVGDVRYNLMVEARELVLVSNLPL